MPNVITLTPLLVPELEDPDEILNAGAYGAGAVLRLQSSATEAGAFADVSGTGSTPSTTVITGTRLYTGYDPLGTVSTWYRVRVENAGATRLGDWCAAFQVAGESDGLICSLYDVAQRMTGTISANNRELLLEFIRDATIDIEGYCSRWFVPRPLSGTATLVLTPTTTGRTLRIPKGIRSVTAIGYAASDQPDTGGTYTTITATDASLRPASIDRDPDFPVATAVQLLDSSSGLFYPVLNGVTITGGFGCAAPPAHIAGIGANVVIRRFTARGSGVAMAAASDDFAGRVLRWTSPEERETLDRIRYRRA